MMQLARTAPLVVVPLLLVPVRITAAVALLGDFDYDPGQHEES